MVMTFPHCDNFSIDPQIIMIYFNVSRKYSYGLIELTQFPTQGRFFVSYVNNDTFYFLALRRPWVNLIAFTRHVDDGRFVITF